MDGNEARAQLKSLDPQVGRQLPRCKCHKEVRALKIAGIHDTAEPNDETDGSRIIEPAEEGYGVFKVTRDFIFNHKPQVGGYYVVYADGYASYSPAQAFEEGYTRV